MKEIQIRDALEELWTIEDSSSKTSRLENLLSFSDAQNLDWLSYEIRLEIIQSAVFSGDIDKALVAYTACIADFDAEKKFALDDSFSILWSSKWINRSLVSFPTISLSQIDSIEKDIAKRFEKHNFGVRAHYMYIWLNAIDTGLTEKARIYRKKWISETIRPEHPRCVACELHFEIYYFVLEKDIKKALHLYRKLLLSSESCNRIPLESHALILPFLTDENEIKYAKMHLESGLYPAQSDMVSTSAKFLAALLQKDDFEGADKVIAHFIGLAFKTKELDQRLNFYRSAEWYFSQEKTHPIFPLIFDGLQLKDKEAARLYFEDQTNQLARRFDERNANHALTESILKIRKERNRVE